MSYIINNSERDNYIRPIFIKLNVINDNEIYVNPNHIILFGPLYKDDKYFDGPNGSYVNIIEFTKPIDVKQTPQEIINLL